MHNSNAIAVFTTPERCDLFRSACGDTADYRFNPYESLPVKSNITHLSQAGATLVVFDEEHFFSISQMVLGIAEYLDDPIAKHDSMQFIVVCSQREPGDIWLSFLAQYCGIYDLIYHTQGTELSSMLMQLIYNPNNRIDVLEVFLSERLLTHEFISSELFDFDTKKERNANSSQVRGSVQGHARKQVQKPKTDDSVQLHNIILPSSALAKGSGLNIAISFRPPS